MTRQPLIAVVDDDLSFRAGLESFIRSLGHRVIGFASAEAFLQSETARRAACIISDIQMPGMSGIELKARLDAEGRDAGVILVTARPEPRVRREAEARGVTCFLGKPFDPGLLVTCIDRALQG